MGSIKRWAFIAPTFRKKDGEDLNMSVAKSADKPQQRYKKVPWIFSMITAILWGMLFLFLGKLHGMWDMFEGEYPLFFASLIGIAKTKLSTVQAVLFAVLDAAVAGWLLGWLFASLLRRMPSSTEV